MQKDPGSDLNFENLITKAGRKSSMNILVGDHIKEILSQDNTLAQIGIQDKMLMEGIILSQPRICQVIKKINFPRKRPKHVSNRVQSTD